MDAARRRVRKPPPSAGDEVSPEVAAIRALQNSAGNAAVARALQRLPMVQRAVTTNGGEFDTVAYTPNSASTGAVGQGLGAHIELEFTANDLVESTKIGLIQSVKALKSSKAGGARDTSATGVGDPEENQLIMDARGAEPGREIDRAVHPGGRAQPNTSPIYGVHNSPGNVASTLGAGTPTTGRSRWGSHTKNPVTGAFLPAVPARIDDTPGRSIEFKGQTYEHTFESTAIAVEGPIPPNTYLGSVSWGWRSDKNGQVTVDALTLVRAGAPSAEFMGAAEKWNAATFHDTSSKAAASTVDIPITTLDSGDVAAAQRTTPDLIARIELVKKQIAKLAAGTDLTNKQFELRALETELPTRQIKITLICRSISDTKGAANPPEDEVWLSVTGGGSPTVAMTATRSFRKGDAHTYSFAATDFLPLSGPIRLEVMEHDRAGDGGREHDDTLIDEPWSAPFLPRISSDAGGHYIAIVNFGK
jgi:hypothetical protein